LDCFSQIPSFRFLGESNVGYFISESVSLKKSKTGDYDEENEEECMTEAVFFILKE